MVRNFYRSQLSCEMWMWHCHDVFSVMCCDMLFSRNGQPKNEPCILQAISKGTLANNMAPNHAVSLYGRMYEILYKDGFW